MAANPFAACPRPSSTPTRLLLLEEYLFLVPVDTLMARQERNNIRAALAGLHAAQFLLTSETGAPQRLSRSKRNRITLGLRKTKATFNRLHPIPFAVAIPAGEIEMGPARMLLAEAQGILGWAVKGAKLWRQHSQLKPPVVAAPNGAWRPEKDQLISSVSAARTAP